MPRKTTKPAPPVILTAEPAAELGYWTAKELAEHPHLRDRHVDAANLVHHGKPSLRNEAPVIGKVYP